MFDVRIVSLTTTIEIVVVVVTAVAMLYPKYLVSVAIGNRQEGVVVVVGLRFGSAVVAAVDSAAVPRIAAVGAAPAQIPLADLAVVEEAVAVDVSAPSEAPASLTVQASFVPASCLRSGRPD